jgi:regulator of nucleoside diphosphate kinase
MHASFLEVAEEIMSLAVVRAMRSPRIVIADTEFDRLYALASTEGFAGSPAAEFLAAELDRAIIRPADEIGTNTVRMNSRVAFRVSTRRDIEVRALVYPEDYARQRDRDDLVSVMTPLGAALIGLRVGTCMSYPTSNAPPPYVTVEAVLHQPEAAERDLGVASEERDGITVSARQSR